MSSRAQDLDQQAGREPPAGPPAGTDHQHLRRQWQARVAALGEHVLRMVQAGHLDVGELRRHCETILPLEHQLTIAPGPATGPSGPWIACCPCGQRLTPRSRSCPSCGRDVSPLLAAVVSPLPPTRARLAPARPGRSQRALPYLGLALILLCLAALSFRAGWRAPLPARRQSAHALPRAASAPVRPHPRRAAASPRHHRPAAARRQPVRSAARPHRRSLPPRAHSARAPTPALQTPALRMPSLVGLSEGEATARLGASGLKWRIMRRPSSAPAGQVIQHSPGPGRALSPGSYVVLVIGLGPARPTPPAGGWLLVEAEPRACAIWVYVDDDRPRGRCPCRLLLPAGEHQVTIWDPAHRQVSHCRVTIRPGERATLFRLLH